MDPAPFPARSKSASLDVNGVATEVMSVFFADKIVVTISQAGRLAQWVHVPLESPSPDAALTGSSFSNDDDTDSPPTDLLPMPHLTATTVLGGTMPARDATGQLYATQIASAILTKDPNERRTVVVGLGLEKAEVARDEFMIVLDGILDLL